MIIEPKFEEWTEIVIAARPGHEIRQAQASGLWRHAAPELEALVGVQQDPKWHPEGDAFIHTCHCMDAFARGWHVDFVRDLSNIVVGFAVLCHDFGKATHTQLVNGVWKSHGHEEAGEAPTRQFLERIDAPRWLVESVVPLVVNHMVPKDLFRLHELGRNTDRAIRRLAARADLKKLARVCHADSGGRPPCPTLSPDAEWLWEMSERPVPPPEPTPILLGRHLLELGFQPGPTMGVILDAALDAQMAGEIADLEQALTFARTHLP